MSAVAAFAASDTGLFLAAVGIDISEQVSDPVIALNLRVAQMEMTRRDEAEEPDFEKKYAGGG